MPLTHKVLKIKLKYTTSKIKCDTKEHKILIRNTYIQSDMLEAKINQAALLYLLNRILRL